MPGTQLLDVAAIIKDAALESELLMTNAAAANLGPAAGDGMEAVADAQIHSQDPQEVEAFCKRFPHIITCPLAGHA